MPIYFGQQLEIVVSFTLAHELFNASIYVLWPLMPNYNNEQMSKKEAKKATTHYRWRGKRDKTAIIEHKITSHDVHAMRNAYDEEEKNVHKCERC